jgi:sugar-specific transcriptional regulator TrmB
MEKDELISIFQEIGLSLYEAKIYCAILEKGKSTSGGILKHSKINTGRIYEILESLYKKGLISVAVENGVKKFSPVRIENVLEYLDKKQKEIENKKITLQKILPALIKKSKKIEGEIKIEIYSGYEGLKKAYSKEIPFYKKSATNYIFGILSYEKYEKKISNFFINTLMPRRFSSKTEVQRIFSEESRDDKTFAQKGTKTKYLPYNSPVSISVISNLTTIGITSKEPLIISIESDEVADSFVQQFKLLWKLAKN